MNQPDNSLNEKKKRTRAKRLYLFILTGLLLIALAIFIAFEVSPWPSAWLIRNEFKKGAAKANTALKKHVPPGITTIRDEQYDRNDPDAFLDVYFPAEIGKTGKTLPAIVWVHGGGFISGNKEQVANYCKILAGKGYTVVSLDYSIAPEEKYPVPLRQLNTALGYLAKNARRLHINALQFILAGDSGGATLAAQEANLISVPTYAALLDIQPSISRSQLAGLLLHCGPYDVNEKALEGDFGKTFNTFLWSYIGEKDFRKNPLFPTIKVVNYVTPDFPPAFISAGNADPLLPYSQSMARKLAKLGVPVDTLFFPANYKPKLHHEYQFNLDTEAGKLALERTINFLTKLKEKTPEAQPNK